MMAMWQKTRVRSFDRSLQRIVAIPARAREPSYFRASLGIRDRDVTRRRGARGEDREE